MLPSKGRARRRVAADGAATSWRPSPSVPLGVWGQEAARPSNWHRDPRRPSILGFQLPHPTPGTRDFKSRMRRGESDRETGATGGRCKKRSRRSLLTTRPMGDRGMRRRVFTCGFPHHVEDFGPSHHLSVIPTACGAASTAAAQPRIAAARWGCHTGF